MAAVTVDGTVVEEEKVDLEIPQEKVDVKKADEAEPEGVFTPAVTESETTRTCANDNGRCCNHYNKREDSHRTTLIILLKTPYAIGTIAALFLHLLLPEDRVLDEEKEHYPRAFSDGEIAYET